MYVLTLMATIVIVVLMIVAITAVNKVLNRIEDLLTATINKGELKENK